jgi:lysophospholipase L1-like esterase
LHLRLLAFSLLPAAFLIAGGEIILRIVEPGWMECVRTHACPSPDGLPRFVTEQKHNFTLETKEPLLVYDPGLFWWARPHVRGTVWSTPGVHTNALGMRQESLDRDPSRANVLIVGDSVVWGTLVEEHERFTDVAASVLRDRGGHRDAQIVNAGMVGFSSYQVLQYLKTRGLMLFSPRVVAVCVGINDAWQVAASDLQEQAATSRPISRMQQALRHSDLFLLLERYLTEGLVWLRTGRNPQGLAFLYPSMTTDQPTLRATPAETEANFREIGGLVESAGAKLVVLIPVTRMEHPPGWNSRAFEEARGRVRALAAEHGWPSIEFSRLADLPWEGPEDHLRDFCHLSPGGHAVVGQWLADVLATLLPRER